MLSASKYLSVQSGLWQGSLNPKEESTKELLRSLSTLQQAQGQRMGKESATMQADAKTLTRHARSGPK